MHEKWMQHAIKIAKNGLGTTAPNPIVGSVIVKNNTIVGEGYHRRAGLPHAEREALADAKRRFSEASLQGASLYVTLEPCSTHGKTPPCTQGIEEAGIAQVIYGSTDPNPAHVGRAKQILEAKGIEVLSGILEQECNALIHDFRKRISTGLPWVVAKTALSLDGKITRPTGESQWLTSAASRRVVHELRAEVDAIIVGGRTLRKDNPSLTIRDIPIEKRKKEKQQPFRVIITHKNREELPNNLQVFTDKHKERTLLFQNIPFLEILKKLADLGCNRVLLECGGGLMAQWFEQDLVDECYFFLAPLITGGSDNAVGGMGAKNYSDALRLDQVTYTQIEQDVLCHGLVQK